MDWNQLQRFLVVAREENFSRAAEILYTSQPALSQMIRRLEAELGYPLFHREGKRISLNESGHIFMRTVEQMESLMVQTRIQLEELNNIPHPQVSIHLAASSPLLPELLLYLRKRSPQIQFQIHQWRGNSLQEDADICILSGPVQSGRSLEDLKNALQPEEHLLLAEDIRLALPHSHPLQQKKQITLRDLLSEEFICLNDQWTLGRDIVSELKRLLFVPKTTMMVDNPNMMRELLKAHLGIAFVPAITWSTFAGSDICLRSVEELQLNRCIYIHTKPRKYLTKEQKECIQGIIEFYSAKNTSNAFLA